MRMCTALGVIIILMEFCQYSWENQEYPNLIFLKKELLEYNGIKSNAYEIIETFKISQPLKAFECNTIAIKKRSFKYLFLLIYYSILAVMNHTANGQEEVFKNMIRSSKIVFKFMKKHFENISSDFEIIYKILINKQSNFNQKDCLTILNKVAFIIVDKSNKVAENIIQKDNEYNWSIFKSVIDGIGEMKDHFPPKIDTDYEDTIYVINILSRNLYIEYGSNKNKLKKIMGKFNQLFIIKQNNKSTLD
ncbi:uncharacterized protein LOC126904284 [Daktulosphaira vitifoliae]|uniref:uncharacterized protein LOC126904284 n=1 Tax=Daktulosphaira vitifoliae TaxID=58002 RepID=UPI0021A9B96E|nr:uncharacterized protein LOC126904284 [Daktulosphaira vitifoliae]XP_050539154.1 uncharacterized protein LOC126904284 [Daktulosphaira vitifoliae]